MYTLVNSQDHRKHQPTAHYAHASPSSFASQHDRTGCVQLGAPLSTTSSSAEFLVGAGSTYPNQGTAEPSGITASGYYGSRNSILFEDTSSRRPPVVASGPVLDNTPTIAGADHQDSSADPTPGKTRRRRRPKPRIELSSDQPPTIRGKPRSRVYVACLQW